MEATETACPRGTVQGNLDDGAEIVSMKCTEVLELWIPEVYLYSFVVVVNLTQTSCSSTSV